MADVFWNEATPIAASGDFGRSFMAIRLAGASPDGSQDIFAQISITALFAALFAGLPDVATGGTKPASGSGLPYLTAGVLSIA